MDQVLTEIEWEQFERDGYLRLGRLLTNEALAALQSRLDDLMLGRAEVDYDRMVMQLETEGAYNRPGEQSCGFKGPTLNYRVVYGLEYDPVFLRYIQRPLFRDICARVYGPDADMATYRAFVMNKPAHGGSDLGWHQDRWTFLDRDPLITVWTALDPATIANGCVQVVKGSHRCGLINPLHESGGITPEQVEHYCHAADIVHLELAPGEAVLLHNWLLHSSAINQTDIPRRGFSVCYMEARTCDGRPLEGRNSLYFKEAYPIVFGDGTLGSERIPVNA